jgi:hypothetical protein
VTSFSDTTAGAGTSYNYRVRAYGARGNSDYSNVATQATTEITAGRMGHWKFYEGGEFVAPGRLTSWPISWDSHFPWVLLDRGDVLVSF